MAATHVEVGSSFRPRMTFANDAGPVDLDAGVPTVTVRRPDGTTISAGTVSHVDPAGSGTYDFGLDALTEVTFLTITWAGPVGGKTQTKVTEIEVIGRYLYLLSELRGLRRNAEPKTPFADAALWPADKLAPKRAQVTDDLAWRVGWSFVPRFAREVRSGTGRDYLFVHQLKASRLLSVTVDGTAKTLADFDLEATGKLTWHGGYFPTTRPNNVVVEYVHGFDPPPAEVANAGMARTAMLLLPSQGSTVSQWTTPDGTTYSYSQAGQRIQGGGKRYYGVPDIDSTLSDYAPGSVVIG